MSRKRDKKILKYLKRRSAPKRVAGVKIPKALRRAADTELGAAIIAAVLVSSAGAALASPAARDLRRKAQKFAEQLAVAIGDTSSDAIDGVTNMIDNRGRRRKRTEDEAVAH